MKQVTKRMTALLLAVIMSMSLLCTGAMADELPSKEELPTETVEEEVSEGGSEADPEQLTSEEPEAGTTTEDISQAEESEEEVSVESEPASEADIKPQSDESSTEDTPPQPQMWLQTAPVVQMRHGHWTIPEALPSVVPVQWLIIRPAHLHGMLTVLKLRLLSSAVE